MQIPLNEQEYDLIRDLIYQQFGIHLGDKKKSLVAGRLQKVLQTKGYTSFAEYYRYLQNDTTGRALNTLINRMSTNHTYFDRETHHFSFFSSVLHEFTSSKKVSADKRLRIWSAGCSSGEEAYTLAMLLHEHFGHGRVRGQAAVLATDISEEMLQKARQAIYSKENVLRLSRDIIKKYFVPLNNGDYQLKDEIRELVLVRRLNLMREQLPFKHKFHIIFCRNVMIYFDKSTRRRLVERFYDVLEEGGYLFIGHSESLGRSDSRFTYIQPAVYQKTAGTKHA